MIGAAMPWHPTPTPLGNYRTLILETMRRVITRRRDRLSRLPDRGPYALQIPTHSGAWITVGPLTAEEATHWEANLAASMSYLTGLAIGGSVRRIPCVDQHDIDPSAIPEAISIGLLSAWASPGIDPIEQLRIALCGQYGPKQARQLMASVPNSYEARQANGQRRPTQPC